MLFSENKCLQSTWWNEEVEAYHQWPRTLSLIKGPQSHNSFFGVTHRQRCFGKFYMGEMLGYWKKWVHVRKRSWDKTESLKQRRWPSLNTRWSLPSQSSSRGMPSHWTEVCSTWIGMSVGCGLTFLHLAAFFVSLFSACSTGPQGASSSPDTLATAKPKTIIHQRAWHMWSFWSLIFIFILNLHSLSLLDYEIRLCFFFFF